MGCVIAILTVLNAIKLLWRVAGMGRFRRGRSGIQTWRLRRGGAVVLQRRSPASDFGDYPPGVPSPVHPDRFKALSQFPSTPLEASKKNLETCRRFCW